MGAYNLLYKMKKRKINEKDAGHGLFLLSILHKTIFFSTRPNEIRHWWISSRKISFNRHIREPSKNGANVINKF